MVEAQGIDRSAGGEHLTIDEGKSILSGASASGEPIAIADLANVADFPMRDAAVEAGLSFGPVVPLVDQQGVLGGGTPAPNFRPA